MDKNPYYEPKIPPRPLFEVDFNSELELTYGRKWGAQTEVGNLKMVLVHRPREEDFPEEVARDPVAYNFPDGLPDLKKMQEQHDGFVEILKKEGVGVVYLNPPSPPRGTYNTLSFLSAPRETLVINGGAIIHREALGVKRGADLIHARRLIELGCPILYTVHGKGVFSGGNVVWIDSQHVLIGLGIRTNLEGVRQVEPILRMAGVEKVHLVELATPLRSRKLVVGGAAGFFHLDMCFGMANHGLAVLYPGAIPYNTLKYLEENKVDMIEVPEEEMKNFACNLLSIRPGKVIIQSGNPYTVEEIRKAGTEVIEFDFSAFKKAGTGFTCATLPLIRETWR
jgi:N-dimethylarginine dimethylaminohydrolase